MCYGVFDGSYDFNLSYIGTGFLINPDGYIVTSAKVLYDEKECKERLSSNIARAYKNKWGEKYQSISKDDIFNSRNFDVNYEEFVLLPKADTPNFKYKIKKSGRDRNQGTETGEDIAIIKIPVTNAATVELGDSNNVQIQDNLITIGYPIPADINLEYNLFGLFSRISDLIEESFFEASVSEGRVSSPNKTLPDGSPVLQIDIRETDGTLGSPLLNEQGKVVGMLVSSNEEGDNIPQALPTTTIWEFIRQSGATNVQGATDEYYKQGLKSFWKGNYKEAKSNFLKVKGLFEHHSEVDKLISEID